MPSTVKSERKNYNFLSVDLAFYVMIIGFLQLWILDVSKFNSTLFWMNIALELMPNVSNYEEECVGYEFVNFWSFDC